MENKYKLTLKKVSDTIKGVINGMERTISVKSNKISGEEVLTRASKKLGVPLSVLRGYLLSEALYSINQDRIDEKRSASVSKTKKDKPLTKEDYAKHLGHYDLMLII
jgi:hypothetical protein